MNTALVIATAFALQAYAQNIGAPYGSRDPVTCASRKAPASGAPSPAQVAQYVQCDPEGGEGVRGHFIHLMTSVKAEIGAGRAFSPIADRMTDIDVRQPVYPIRGSYNWYQCGNVRGGAPAGANCGLYVESNATGKCYKTTFGDWRCIMNDATAVAKGPKFGVAPPQ